MSRVIQTQNQKYVRQGDHVAINLEFPASETAQPFFLLALNANTQLVLEGFITISFTERRNFTLKLKDWKNIPYFPKTIKAGDKICFRVAICEKEYISGKGYFVSKTYSTSEFYVALVE